MSRIGRGAVSITISQGKCCNTVSTTIFTSSVASWTCVKDSAMRPYGKSSLGHFKLLAALAGHEPTDPLKLSEQTEPALDDFGGLCAKRLLTNELSRIHPSSFTAVGSVRSCCSRAILRSDCIDIGLRT